jgi:hypothetical protein
MSIHVRPHNMSWAFQAGGKGQGIVNNLALPGTFVLDGIVRH